jgi:hypothetical protein
MFAHGSLCKNIVQDVLKSREIFTGSGRRKIYLGMGTGWPRVCKACVGDLAPLPADR